MFGLTYIDGCWIRGGLHQYLACPEKARQTRAACAGNEIGAKLLAPVCPLVVGLLWT